MNTPPDGFVQGKINTNGTKGTVIANVSCLNSIPTGSISGTIEIGTGKGVSKYSFKSGHPFLVGTLKNSKYTSAGVAFSKVKLLDVANNILTPNCSAFLTATKINNGYWIGSYEITYPDGRHLIMYGIFTGTVIATKSLICTRLVT